MYLAQKSIPVFGSYIRFAFIKQGIEKLHPHKSLSQQQIKPGKVFCNTHDLS